MRTFRMYADRTPREGRPPFSNVLRNELAVRASARAPDIVEVLVRERAEGDPESPYWGWIGAERDEPQMVMPSYRALCTCFFGETAMLARQRDGLGRPVNLVVEAAAAPEPEPDADCGRAFGI